MRSTLEANVVKLTYKATPKWKVYVKVSGRGLSLSGFEDGSRGVVIDLSMKAETVLEDSLNGKSHERSQLEYSMATSRLGSRTPCESLILTKNASQQSYQAKARPRHSLQNQR